MSSPESRAAPDKQPDDGPADTPAVPAPQHRVITTEELFAGSREVWIQHGDVLYRLRITSAGKLIMTK